jgi:hypothetical protein
MRLRHRVGCQHFFPVVSARAEQLANDPDIKAALEAKTRHHVGKVRKVLSIKPP